MSQSYDYAKVYTSEQHVNEMLEGIGVAIEMLKGHADIPASEIIAALERSREIGAEILCDVTADDEDNWDREVHT